MAERDQPQQPVIIQQGACWQFAIDFARMMSPIGTFETCRDVRSSVAIRGKADVLRIIHFGSD